MSESEVLFSVTEKQLNTGLRGVPVGTCRTSRVDPNQGVSYIGYPISEVAYRDPEDVAFLLLERRLHVARRELGLPREVDVRRDELQHRLGRAGLAAHARAAACDACGSTQPLAPSRGQ